MSVCLSIYRVSVLGWKHLCKRRTQHQKIADIFQSGAKWQKTNVFPIENTLSIILIHNRMVMSGDVLFPGLRNFAFSFFPFGVYSGMKKANEGDIKSLLARFSLLSTYSQCSILWDTEHSFMFWIAMSTKIWSLIIVSVKTPPTGIYRAKQSSVPCLPGSWHMIECAIFVITGQCCAGWCTYYFTSSRSQNRIMTCYEWPRNHCAVFRDAKPSTTKKHLPPIKPHF